MRRSRALTTLALLTAATLVTGCASDGHRVRTSAKPTPSAPTQALITWMDKICAADADLQTQQSAARVAALSITARHPTPKQLAGFAAAVRDGLEKNLKKFRKAGRAGIPGGDRVTAAYITAVTGAVSKLKKAEKSAKDPSTPAFIRSYLPQQVSSYTQAAAPKGTDLPTLTAHSPTADQAYKKSPNCKGTPLTAKPSG